MKNYTDWMKEIDDLYEGQKTNRIRPPQAVEMNNTIGKMISLVKTKLDYDKTRKLLGDKATVLPSLEAPTEGQTRP